MKNCRLSAFYVIIFKRKRHCEKSIIFIFTSWAASYLDGPALWFQIIIWSKLKKSISTKEQVRSQCLLYATAADGRHEFYKTLCVLLRLTNWFCVLNNNHRKPIMHQIWINNHKDIVDYFEGLLKEDDVLLAFPFGFH